jgi:PAS domain S-box-containing protein
MIASLAALELLAGRCRVRRTATPSGRASPEPAGEAKMRRFLDARVLIGMTLLCSLLAAGFAAMEVLPHIGSASAILTIILSTASLAAGVTAYRTVTGFAEEKRCLRTMLEEAERAARLARIEYARLRGAFEVLPEPVILFDAQDRVVMWNRLYEENSTLAQGRGDGRLRPGLSFEESIRANLARRVFPEAEGREEEWLEARLARHAEPSNTFEQQLSGGRWVRIEERRTEDGGNVGVRIDITELKRREASFRLLFDENPAPMFVFDRATLQFLAVNQAMLSHYGYHKEEFLAMSITEVLPQDERETLRSVIPTLGEHKLNSGRVWRNVKADGSEILIITYSRMIEYEGRPCRLTAVVDVTERVKVENELRSTRAFLEQVIDNVPLCITVKDANDLRFAMLNKAAEQYWGVSRTEAVGKSAGDLVGEKMAK